jgi:hypothetical protein
MGLGALSLKRADTTKIVHIGWACVIVSAQLFLVIISLQEGGAVAGATEG